MLIKLSQLRKIIREELTRTLREDVSSPSPMVQKLAGSGLGPISVTPISLRSLMTKAEKTGDMSLFDEWDTIVAAAREAKQALSSKRGTTRSERTEAIETALVNQGLDPAGGDDEYGYVGYVGTLVDSMRSFGEPPTRDDILAALELRKQKREAHESREASPEDIKKLENLLATHDWGYERAEGLQSAYTKGAAQAQEIKRLVDKMGKTGRDMYVAAAAKNS